MRLVTSLLFVCLVAPSFLWADVTTGYPPTRFPDAAGWGRNVQRTMRLLATSTPQHRNTVRILFYGQSITALGWPHLVEENLRQKFPDANLIIENRALGGFAASMLVRAAETDLYPFQPDLLVFHVYGSNVSYEDIIRRVRERTTAEILIQTDHVVRPADFTEEADPEKLAASQEHWDAFMNHRWLPMLAKKYGAELCDQRTLWKAYLRQNKLEPRALLQDDVHLNAQGDWLMAKCVTAYLRYDPAFGAQAPADEGVKTYTVGTDIFWANGKMEIKFEGSRVDVIFGSGTPAKATVKIDGRLPSAWPELYGFTRAQLAGNPRAKWPLIAPIGSQERLLVEEWALTADRETADPLQYSFALSGSKTGADGSGHSDTRFVSQSGRVVISPADWNVAYALRLAGIKSPPEHLVVQWAAVPHCIDEFTSPATSDPTTETTLTLAQGLPNARHTLEIAGAEEAPIKAVRIYRPPGGRIN